MSGKFFQAFRGQEHELITMISVENPLLTKLVDAAIINGQQREQILSKSTSYDKGCELFRYLKLCSNRKFDNFCEILATEREDAVLLMYRNLQPLPIPGVGAAQNNATDTVAAATEWRPKTCDSLNETVEKWPSDVLKEAYKKLQPTITATLNVRDVTDDLFAADIVKLENVQDLNCIENGRDSAQQLLFLLHASKNPNTFQVLHSTLLSSRNYSIYSSLVIDIEERCKEIEQSKQAAPELSNKLQTDDLLRISANDCEIKLQNKPTEGSLPPRPITESTNTCLTLFKPNSESERSSTAAVTHVIDSEGCLGFVAGLTVHGDELFIVRSLPRGQIEVYNATNFKFQRNIEIKELEDSTFSQVSACGLTSCEINNCLYVSGCCKEWLVFRVELCGENKIVKWKVSCGGVPRGLSVNSSHNLVVVCDGPALRLAEYTTRGEWVRQILLRNDLMFPHHAIQLNSSQFVVSHGDGGASLQRVCVIDVTGNVLRSYGNKRGSDTGQLNDPQQLAVDKNGFIFVADDVNNRVLVLDSDLQCSRDLRIEGGIKRPLCLCLDETRGLLFIGEWDGDNSRVVVVVVTDQRVD